MMNRETSSSIMVKGESSMVLRPGSLFFRTALRTRLFSLGQIYLGLLVFLIAAPMEHANSQGVSAVNSPTPRPWDQNPDGMHVYIWAGLKSHFPGQHDYPQFLADSRKILTQHRSALY